MCRRIAGVLALGAAWVACGAGIEEEQTALEQVRACIAQGLEEGTITRTNANWRTKLPPFPEVEFGAEALFLHLQTNRGAARIRLLPEAAPRHVANLMYLVELGFYDGMAFQFIRAGERVQTGCPIGDGTGTPGYTFSGEYASGRGHDKAGLLSMANAGRHTDGCQFFITLGPMPWMDERHTIFGEVRENMETFHRIGEAGTKLGIPREKVGIEKAAIEERPRTADELAAESE